MFKTIEDHTWSVCLAAGWPFKVEEVDVLDEKRVSIEPDEAIKLAQMCQRRLTMDGAYLNGACPECPMKHRLNLECID